MRRTLTAVLTAAALTVASVSLIPSATAAPAVTTDPAETVVVAGLENEGLVVEEVVVDVDSVEVVAEAESPADPFAFDLELDPGTASGSYTVTDDVDGRVVTTTFEVAITTSTPERTVFELTNPETGETFHYDSAVPTESVAFVIPVAFAAVSLSTALYYLAIGAAIVIGGVLALEAGKAVARIIEDNNRRSSSNKRDYYTAVRNGGSVYISPTGLTKSQALTRGRGGGDVWAISATKAKQLAKDLNPSGVPVGAEKHGAGYLWHYHPFRHSPNMHSFYGSPA